MVAERCHSSDFVRGVRTLLNSLNSLSLQILKPLSNSLNIIFFMSYLPVLFFASHFCFVIFHPASTELE